jgi:glutaredoxin-like YruB-family protein
MAQPRVIIFTQPDCPPCRWVKSFLSDKGVEFEERDLSLDPQAVHDLVNVYESRSTPTLVVGEQVFIGFDPEQLQEVFSSQISDS